jgi:hypothetical protein
MPLPRTIDIDGRRYAWRDLIALRRAHSPVIHGNRPDRD